MMTNLQVSMAALTERVCRAGDAILAHYGKDASVTQKADGSPLTAADRAAHDLLVHELPRLLDVPVRSEESEDPAGFREAARTHWLVDPLDGTKEFLKGTGEFTVNVALVHDGVPVLGVVHAPVLRRTWRAVRGGKAERVEPGAPPRPIRTRRIPSEAPVIVASRDHEGPAVGAFVKAVGPGARSTRLGSSLKFCVVAEGEADLYLRDLPTMEWDTGAAQCIVEAAGGRVLALDGRRPPRSLRYDKPDLRNPPLLTVGDLEAPWETWLARTPLPAA